MPSEKELRELIHKLAEPVQRGEITTRREFLEKQKELLKKLDEDYNLFLGRRKSYPFRLLTERNRITWNNVKQKIFIKEALVFFYCLWNVKNIRKDLSDKLSINKRVLSKHKLKVTIVLLEYGIIRKSLLLPKKEKKSERKLKKILKIYYEKYLNGEYTGYRQFSNVTRHVVEKLEGYTLSQLLEEFGHEIPRKTWKTRSGPWLENYIVNQLEEELETDTYEDMKVFQSKNMNSIKLLRERHYTTVLDAVIKTKVNPKYEFLPYILDYLVHHFLKKRIIKTSKREITHLPRELTADMLRLDRCVGNTGKKLVSKAQYTWGTAQLMTLVDEYLCQVYDRLKELTPKNATSEFLKEILNIEEEVVVRRKDEIPAVAAAAGGSIE